MTYKESEQDKENQNSVPILPKGIGTRISKVCSKLGTRKYAANIAGVSTDSLQRYIREDISPTLETISKLTLAANESLDWVITGKQPSLPSHPKSNVKNLKLDIFNDAVDYRASGNSSLSPEEVQEQRITEVRNDFRKKMHDYKDATIEIGYTPPTLITEAIKTIMYSQGLTKSGAVILLNALKQQQNLNKKGS